MKDLLCFLVERNYDAQLRGKTWWSALTYMEGYKATKRHFQVGFEVVFTVEMVESVQILPDNRVIINLVK